MKRHVPTLSLVAAALWILDGIVAMIRHDYSQAGLGFSIATVFFCVGAGFRDPKSKWK
jgi:hypothetical protein